MNILKLLFSHVDRLVGEVKVNWIAYITSGLQSHPRAFLFFQQLFFCTTSEYKIDNYSQLVTSLRCLPPYLVHIASAHTAPEKRREFMTQNK